MIDLHSHIIAGIDDGARTLHDSVEMAHNCVEAGVTHLMCTPHIHFGVFDNNAASIEYAFAQTVNALNQANIPLQLAMGCEVRITPEIIDLVKSKQLPFIGTWQGKAALLLELPHSHIPAGVENMIKWLHANDVQPVIPHPERNREILSQYGKARWLKQLGCIFQATAGAYVGRFSKVVEQTVWTMHGEGLIAYIASDMHSVKNRPNDMHKAYEAICARFGKEQADEVCMHVPKNLTNRVVWQ